MSLCVLDSSAALAWVLPGESDAAILALLGDISRAGATTTSLWSLETANVLLMAERRKRITKSERHRALQSLSNLSIEIDSQTGMRAWTDTLAMADANNLTIYDASYLEAAIRLRLPLATRDAALRRAAADCGVAMLC